MIRENTTWSQPKTNIFAGTLDLYNALQSNVNAVLVKEWNENCKHPINKKSINNDLRCYESMYSMISTKENILNDNNLSDFQKHLSLNYKNCYGTQEAVDKYYQTGELTMDNVQGVGRAYLVKITDLIEMLRKYNPDGSRRQQIESLAQHINNDNDNKQWYDFFKLKRGNSNYTTKKFKRKLWVVALLNDKDEKPKQSLRIKILLKAFNIIGSVTKYIPEKHVLKMPEYVLYKWRIGGITNGYSIEIQIPKKFSFK